METDIVVLGGGPAGSVLALRLALLGHAVTLVERAAFPRSQVGESLGPAITYLLNVVGLRERVEAAGFFRPRAAFVRWEGEETDIKDFGDEPGYQVDRGRFDKLLLEAAVEAGVRVLQPGTALRPQRRDGGGWVVPVRCPDQEFALTARYCADACGRLSLLGGTRTKLAPLTLALYAYWRGTDLAGCETRVEAGDTEWYWGAPLPDGTFNAAVFLDPKRCAGHSRAWVADLYHSLIGRSALLKGCLNGTIVGGVKARDATSSISDTLIGENFLRVGEAAFTIDPLSSQGVQTALLTALQAAAVVNTALRQPGDVAHAMEFYRDRQGRLAEQFHKLSKQFYSVRARRSAGKFWRERAADPSHERAEAHSQPLPLGARLRLATDARLLQRPVLCGNLIVLEQALVSPRLEEPCAFVNGVRLAPLLAQLGSGQRIDKILLAWAEHLPLSAAERVLHWLWGIGALSPCEDGA